MMESELNISRIGNYSMKQAKPDEHCRMCHNEKMGDVLIDGICGECLAYFHATNYGNWGTDSINILNLLCDPENQPHQFVGRVEELREKYFWKIK